MRNKYTVLLLSLILISGCTQFVFEGEPPACEPDKGVPKDCMDLINPVRGRIDAKFVEGYVDDPVLANVSICETGEQALSGVTGCTPESFKHVMSGFISEVTRAVSGSGPRVDKLITDRMEISWATICDRPSCVHDSLMTASRALRLSRYTADLRNGTVPTSEELAVLTVPERKLLLDYPSLYESRVVEAGEESQKNIKEFGVSGLGPEAPLETFKEELEKSKTLLADEGERIPGLVTMRILPAALVGCFLVLIIIIAYDRKYRAQIEFWKTFTSSTNIVHPRSVALGALGVSVVLAIAGAVLLLLGRG